MMRKPNPLDRPVTVARTPRPDQGPLKISQPKPRPVNPRPACTFDLGRQFDQSFAQIFGE